MLVNYLQLENSVFIPLACKLSKQNISIYSSSLSVGTLWQWRGIQKNALLLKALEIKCTTLKDQQEAEVEF